MGKHLTRGRVWIAAVLMHLTMMTAGAFGLNGYQIPIPAIGLGLGYYGELSGASHGYGFFTPGIYGQMRTVIDIYDRSGHKTTTGLQAGNNREVDLRVNDIIDGFVSEFTDKVRFQRILAASLAGSVFTRHAEAERVQVRVEELNAPSRKAFLAGKIPAWKQLYSVKFTHKKTPEKK